MRPIPFLSAAVAVAILATPAAAWKPRTHVYLAEQAMADALDDGKVTIFEIDPATNRIKTDASGRPAEIGRYVVEPRILDALRHHPKQFRAGVIGPDAFPDILTGQQIIHPAGKVTPGETGVDLNANGPGPDRWMRHLWSVAFGLAGADATPATRAFVVGFLAHAAGDVYGHTCVNHYTGDAFHFRPQPLNAVRHVVIEGYFDKHVPNPTYESSIADGVDGFIYRHMVYGAPKSTLDGLLSGDNVKLTLAGRFSKLRNQLAADVARAAANDPLTMYKKAWIQDLDAGLKNLPEVSHQLAVALMFNPTGKADTDKAKKILDDYVKRHLLSMAGAPDAIGATFAFLDKILDALGAQALRAFVQEIQRDALNYVLQRAIGMSADDLKKYLENPAAQFDPVMNQRPLQYGRQTTRAAFDREELRLTPGQGWIDVRRVPPAYNTVTMIKLAFLGPTEVNRLMADLKTKEKLTEPNAMLGFCATLDGSNQWRVNPTKMIVARDATAYKRVFMTQSGEDRPVNVQVVGPPPGGVDYLVAVHTGDVVGAGTDSNIFLTITGKNGTTGELRLNGLIGGNAFERNQTDTVTLNGIKDVGEITSITVRSDDRFPASAWYLGWIEVTPPGKAAIRFDCNDWVQEGKLTRTLKR